MTASLNPLTTPNTLSSRPSPRARLWIVFCVFSVFSGSLAVNTLNVSGLTILAPAAPGGGWDQKARALQLALAGVEPGVSVQVDNVAGAAGTIGLARFVSSERGNPGALLVTGNTMLSGITLNRSPVTLADTTPIARLTGEAELIVVPAASPIRTFADLRAAFTASPSAVAWGGGSAGGTDDLLIRVLAESIGVPPQRVNYIAFAGGGAALAALLGGQVTVGVSGFGEFAAQIEAGTLRPLAVSSARRIPGIEAPTLRELGLDLDFSNWRGIVAPPGLTDAERDALTRRIERVAMSAQWHTVLQRYGWDDMLLTGAAFKQFLLAEQSRVNTVLQRLNADADTTARGARFTPTPQFAPVLVLTGLALLLAATLLRGRAYLNILPTAGTFRDALPRSGDARAAWLALALATHAIAMPLIGFVPAGTALFVCATALFGSRRWSRNLAIGLATTAILYVTFTAGLGMALPKDPLTVWLTR
jgi:putative tricarboxylic transport membrane protein